MPEFRSVVSDIDFSGATRVVVPPTAFQMPDVTFPDVDLVVAHSFHVGRSPVVVGVFEAKSLSGHVGPQGYRPAAYDVFDAYLGPRALSEGSSSASDFQVVLRRIREAQDGVSLVVGDAVLLVRGEFLEAIQQIIASLDEGRTVAVVSANEELDAAKELTSQEAADLLNVSRPHVVRLAKEGLLPHRMVGNRHRFRAADVIAFEEESRRVRAGALAGLVPEEGYDENDF